MQRFKPSIDFGLVQMEASHDGEWVRYSYAQAEIARLTAALAESEAKAAKWQADARIMLGFAELAYNAGIQPSSSELVAARDAALAAYVKQHVEAETRRIGIIISEECLAVREGKLRDAILARLDQPAGEA